MAILLKECKAESTGLGMWKPPAFEISVVSLLKSNILSAVGAIAGAASEAAEFRKHTANDTRVWNWGGGGVHPSCGGVLIGMGQGGSEVFCILLCCPWLCA